MVELLELKKRRARTYLFQTLTASVEERRAEKKEICQEQSGATLKKEMAVIRFTRGKADKSLRRSEDKQDAEASEEAISVLRGAIHARINEWKQNIRAMIREASVEIDELLASLQSKEAESSRRQHEMEMLQETVKEKTEELKSLEQQSEQADADTESGLTQEEVGWILVIRYTALEHTKLSLLNEFVLKSNLLKNMLLYSNDKATCWCICPRPLLTTSFLGSFISRPPKARAAWERGYPLINRSRQL